MGSFAGTLRAIENYIRAAAALSRLGASPTAAAKVAIVTCLMPLKRLAPAFAARWTRLDLRYGGRIVRWHVSDGSELLCLADILCFEQYRLPAHLAPATIVDLGSNVGSSVLYFATRYPGVRIVAVEPDPATFGKLRANVGSIEGVEAICVAVGGTDGEAAFYPSPRTWESSFRPTPLSGEPISVRVVTLDTLLAELGLDRVDLVKLDVEGAEYEVLRASRALRTSVGAVIGELHPGLPETYAAMRELLADLEGFQVEYVRDARDELFRAVRADAGSARSAPAR
ncbi:MAG TPA: FkbM family methyltransferase [Solirubrobacteraceae bacterium]|nr:FkbM family methyltransferase [Solirubrobacteraceae bacterium]